jgi:hypothetical protein
MCPNSCPLQTTLHILNEPVARIGLEVSWSSPVHVAAPTAMYSGDPHAAATSYFVYTLRAEVLQITDPVQKELTSGCRAHNEPFVGDRIRVITCTYFAFLWLSVECLKRSCRFLVLSEHSRR